MLKHILGYSQLELNNLGVAKDVGDSVGTLAGYFCNKLPAWSILLVGAMEGLVGYGALWLVASEKIDPLPYWQMCLILCVAANSTTWFNTAILVTMMRNFPNSRGTVVGISKGFVGLSGAIFTQLYTSYLGRDPVSLLALLAVGPAIVCLIAMSFIHPNSGASKGNSEEQKNFFVLHVLCIGLALYLLIATLTEQFFSLDKSNITKVITGGMLIFLIAPLVVPVKLYLEDLYRDRNGLVHESVSPEVEQLHKPLLKERKERISSHVVTGEANINNGIKTSRMTSSSELELDNDTEILLAVGEGAVPRRRKPRRGEDFNLRQALVKADFWLLFFTFFFGIGSGVTAINNLGQIGEAQGYSDVSVFVAVFGIWNFLGRLAGGAISEQYIRSGVPRTVWIGAAQLLMIVAYFLFAFALPGSLYIGCTILGLCYGVHFSVMVPTASELFGLKHFGKIYNVLTISDPIASLLFSGFLAGYLYDREAKKDNGWTMKVSGLKDTSWTPRFGPADPYGLHCIGAHCFRLTFILMAAVCAVGVIFNIILSLRIRPVYETLYGSNSVQEINQLEEAHDSIPSSS
ncbi:hypothetical protein O6H91_06G061600 [Diphasiastrum complanatum]|nr:hypothetical protein O6H91_Y018400 [Diphasiastrum complanatum]KAJ7552609.1 hypothetical protein O6H91_06G061600 [Diphasiastrum complanatum]